MIYFLSILVFVLVLKYIELGGAILWALKCDCSEFINSIDAIKQLDKASFEKLINTSNHPNVYFHNWPKWLIFLNQIFRYPLLILLLFIIVIISASKQIAYPEIFEYVMVFVVFIGILFETIHVLVYRFKFGAYDNLMLSTSTRFFDIKNRGIHFIRNIIAMYGVLFVTFIISYMMIFYFLPVEVGLRYANSSGSVVGKTGLDLITYLYFTVSTLCTVGYGDIHAGHYWSQFFVSTEMVFAFILFILVLSAVGKANDV